ncbi:phenylalanine--tRNA ligase subunit beta [Deltaproteobacteria bacterium TL4]
MALLVPVSWLKDYIEISISPEELAERLTIAGLEVETIENIGEKWEDGLFYVGKILEVQPHPNADSLYIVTVDYGAAEPIQVVSGAPNLKAYEGNLPEHSLKVPLALSGALFVDPHRGTGKQYVSLKPTKIRGVRSEAMICSELELGLGERHEGVMILPNEAPTGTSLKEYLGDAVLHFDIKGGFSHLLSILGIARETAALCALNMDKSTVPQNLVEAVTTSAQPPYIHLKIENPDLCPRYSALLIRNVKVGPSPFWMQQRLLRCGMRPINNIVDITNYVMLEYGQPLHAFDYKLLQKRASVHVPTIIVRQARAEEKITTLDQEERALDTEMLLIADSVGPIAIAGIMGGGETEVSANTVDVLLESASFEFLNNRRTSQLLKLRTEASERFGKQLDPELPLIAAIRAIQLMKEYADGTIEPVYGDLYVKKKEPVYLSLDPAYLKRLLGVEIPIAEITRILSALEFEVEPSIPMKVKAPSHRMDIQIPADLVEEVVRIYGYNRIPASMIKDELPPQRENRRLLGTEKIRDLLVSSGLDEVITYSITDVQKEIRLSPEGTLDPSHFVVLKNPLSQERAHLRRNLLPGLLTTAQQNIRFHSRIGIFEVGSVFHPEEGQLLPNEPLRLSILMTGNRVASCWLNSKNEEKVDFFDLKGVVEGLFRGLHIQNVVWKKRSIHPYHPGRCAELVSHGESWGYLGELHPKFGKSFDLPDQPVCVLELNLDSILKHWVDNHPMSPLSNYAPIYEDLAFVVDEHVPAEMVTPLIYRVGRPLLQKVVLFDVFEGAQVGKGKKSLAYALTYQSFERTLSDHDVEEVRNKIINRLKHELNATLRV